MKQRPINQPLATRVKVIRGGRPSEGIEGVELEIEDYEMLEGDVFVCYV